MKPKQTSTQGKSSINWEELNNRIKESERLVQRGWKLTAKEKQDLLRKRALELSSETNPEPEQEAHMDILTFRLASEIYGIENRYVRELFHLKSFTSLPGAPDFLLGIVNFRGQIISVIDFKKFFNMSDSGLGEMNKVIILHNENMEFGVLADEITGIRKVRDDELQEELPTLKDIRKKYLRGITKDRLIVIDGDKLLNDNKIVINDKKVQ